MLPLVLTLSILKISIVHIVNDVYYSFKTRTSQYQGKKTAVHSQRTYKYLSWSVSPCIVPWCIWVSLLEDRSLKTDKFQTIMWRCLFQVDLNEDKPVCNGPRSRMRRVRCTHYKTYYQIFPLCWAQTLQIE